MEDAQLASFVAEVEAATHSTRKLGNGAAVLLWMPIGTPVKHLMSNVGNHVQHRFSMNGKTLHSPVCHAFKAH